MARNADGSVVLKTTGKIAATPTGGTGRGITLPWARKVTAGTKVRVGDLKGRTIAKRSSK